MKKEGKTVFLKKLREFRKELYEMEGKRADDSLSEAAWYFREWREWDTSMPKGFMVCEASFDVPSEKEERMFRMKYKKFLAEATAMFPLPRMAMEEIEFQIQQLSSRKLEKWEVERLISLV